MKKYLVFILIISFICTNIYPVLGFNLLEKQNYNKQIQNSLSLNQFEEHPDNYNITIYRFHGNNYEVVIKQVSYEDVLNIKQEYQIIEETENNLRNQLEKELEILKKYNILAEEDSLGNFKKEALKMINLTTLLNIKQRFLIYKEQLNIKSPLIFDIGGLSIGRFYGPTIDMFNLFFLGYPLIIIASGADIFHLAFLMIPLKLSSREIVVYMSMLFVGVIILIPFFDLNGGFIAGMSVITIAGTI